MEPRPIRLLKNLGRSRQIATVLLMHGFGDILERLHLGPYVQWGKRILFWWRMQESVPRRSRAERIRLALESLGATFIKFGQVMSTRPDLLPPDVIAELSKLQEKVPPFPSDVALQVLRDEFGTSAEELFAEFDPVPIAAGSLAQVHQAVHQDGTKLAVKIRRPNIIRDVEADLSLMQDLALLIERHIPESQTFDPVGLVNQFARTIHREMNFVREGRTIKEFARMFRNDATLVVPDVYEELTTEAVITMAFVGGCRIDNKAALEEMGLATRPLAANGARIFMKQAFELGVFHGDPHPGNIRILRDGSVCLLDYGMVGTLDDDSRETLVDLILAIHRRNVNLAVDLMLVLGEAWRHVDIPVLRADLADFIENYYGMPLERVKVGRMLSDFVHMVAHHGIRFPCDLMLLVRALVTLEGVGRDLDPEFNLAEHLAPFIERVVRDRYNPNRIANQLFQEGRAFLRLLHDTPLHIARTIEKVSEDDFRIQLEHRGLETLITELDRSGNRIVIGLVLASLIVASALVITRGANITLWFSVPVFAVSSLLGVWLIYGIFRSGRL